MPEASEMDWADNLSRSLISEETIHGIIQLVPDEWLLIDSPFETVQRHREAYEQYLISRFNQSSNFVKEAQDARKILI